ncbi:hypothetical protein AGMMS49975_17790 [Clostridia bacterium]|nr:hypothetical protein AGMMS49975_17790 [Clostridia bacterium]
MANTITGLEKKIEIKQQQLSKKGAEVSTLQEEIRGLETELRKLQFDEIVKTMTKKEISLNDIKAAIENGTIKPKTAENPVQKTAEKLETASAELEEDEE